jgi:hypothetical protein
MKVCRRCFKPESEVRFLPKRRKCESCRSSEKKAYYEAHREAKLAYEASRRSPERREYLRFKSIERSFGVSKGRYFEILASQGGGCAICGGPSKGIGKFHVDHCHKTGVVRGLLCSECNLGLGKFKDDPGRLRRAASYLEIKRG